MTPAPCREGDRIRLILMTDDPCPIPPGTTGTVTRVSEFHMFNQVDKFQISVKWDIERSLSLIWPKDQFEILP